MNSDYQQFINAMGYSGLSVGFISLLAILSVWDLVWRGIALWKASKNNKQYWFIALLIFNTVGILPIIYIFFFSNKKSKTVV